MAEGLEHLEDVAGAMTEIADKLKCTTDGREVNVTEMIFAVANAGSQIADALHDVADAIRQTQN